MEQSGRGRRRRGDEGPGEEGKRRIGKEGPVKGGKRGEKTALREEGS